MPDIIGSVVGVVSTLIDKFIPDPAAKAQALQKLQEMEQAGELQAMAGQNDINKIEAANPNIFISGWRPFIGWVCGLALIVQVVIGPALVWTAQFVGHPMALVELDVNLLTTMLITMLGLGGMRTAEKMTNSEGNR